MNIRSIHDRRGESFNTDTGNVDGLEKHYGRVFGGAGFKAPERQVNIIAYQRLIRKKYSEALIFFNYNTRMYPASANVHDGLGEVLEKSGRLKEALISYQRALELGEKTNHNRLGVFRINRDRVAEAIKKQ